MGSEQPAPRAEGLVAFGERLRRQRIEKGISLRELARRVGVSPSLVSQIENDKVLPSVSTLYGIVNVIGGSLDELVFEAAAPTDTVVERHLDDHPQVVPVQRAADRKTIELSTGVRWERLTTASVPGIDFLHVTYRPQGASSEPGSMQRHVGREWGHILAGELHVQVGSEVHVLGPGDSVTLDSSTPHRLWNEGEDDVEAVWFVLGRTGR